MSVEATPEQKRERKREREREFLPAGKIRTGGGGGGVRGGGGLERRSPSSVVAFFSLYHFLSVSFLCTFSRSLCLFPLFFLSLSLSVSFCCSACSLNVAWVTPGRWNFPTLPHRADRTGRLREISHGTRSRKELDGEEPALLRRSLFFFLRLSIPPSLLIPCSGR